MSANNFKKPNPENSECSSISPLPISEVTPIASPVSPTQSGLTPVNATIKRSNISGDSPLLNMPLIFTTPFKEGISGDTNGTVQTVTDAENNFNTSCSDTTGSVSDKVVESSTRSGVVSPIYISRKSIVMGNPCEESQIDSELVNLSSDSSSSSSSASGSDIEVVEATVLPSALQEPRNNTDELVQICTQFENERENLPVSNSSIVDSTMEADTSQETTIDMVCESTPDATTDSFSEPAQSVSILADKSSPSANLSKLDAPQKPVESQNSTESLVLNATVLNTTDSRAILRVIHPSAPRTKYRPIARSPYTPAPSNVSPFKLTDLKRKSKKITPEKQKPRKPTYIKPKGIVRKLRSKPVRTEIAIKLCERVDKQSEQKVPQNSEANATKLSSTEVKEDEMEEEFFTQDDSEEIDQQEQHLRAFLKASSTIEQKERRGTQSGLGSSVSQGQKLNAQQRKLKARINDLSSGGNVSAQNKVLAQDYLNRIAQAGDDVFQKFLLLLQKFDPSKETTLQLYEKAKVILKDHPSLKNGFMAFMKPEESIEVNQFETFCTIERMREFLEKLQHQFGSNSPRVSKFLQCLQTLQTKPEEFSLEKLEDVMKPILRYPHLNEAFVRCFPSGPPIESLSSDFEQIDLDNSPTDGFETIDMTQDEMPQSSSDQCSCNCHPENYSKSQSSNKSDQKPTRTDHCVSCGLRFIDGRVYLQCGKILKPAKVTYLVGKKDEEQQKPTDEKKEPKKKFKASKPKSSTRTRKLAKNVNDGSQDVEDGSATDKEKSAVLR